MAANQKYQSGRAIISVRGAMPSISANGERYPTLLSKRIIGASLRQQQNNLTSYAASGKMQSSLR